MCIPLTKKIIRFSYAIALSHFSLYSFSQVPASKFYITHGNNLAEVSCGGIRFAPMRNQNQQAWGAGSVWFRNQVDLSKSVEISFILDFNDTTGVDGGAFVLQSDSTAVGDTFDGLGYRNVKKSIAITFDVKRNSSDNDPAFDHISIQKNGDIKHGTSNELATPVSIAPYYRYTYYPPPDAPVYAFHHLITVKWDPASQIIAAYIDHNLVISAKDDIVQTIFGGNPIVYSGFTASNTQDISYPPGKELTFGYFYYFFGDVYPRFYSDPLLDTCFGKPIQFLDSSLYALDSFYNNIQFSKWYWEFGDGQISTVRNPLPHDYPGPGEYVVKFTVSNSLGCTFDSIVRTVHLGSQPTVDFFVEGPSCNNAPILFKDKSVSTVGPATALTWNFDNISTSIEQNPSVVFPTPGQKNVTLHVRTYYGCEGEKTKIIEVEEKPTIDFTTIKDCDGNVSFTSTVTNNTSVKSWNWSFGDLTSSRIADPSHHYFPNGKYSASLIAVSNAGCISDSATKNIVINKIYPNAGNDTVLSVHEPLQLHASGGENYQWLPTTGLNNSNIADPIAVLDRDQSYILIITNNDGCEARDSLNIKVYKGPEVYLPNAFTPNGDGHNDVLKLVAPGIRTLNYFRIYNKSGILLFETSDMKKGWDGSFSGRTQPAGAYIWMLSATDINGKKFFKKGVAILIR